jgi:hypothetical protein
MERSTMSSGVTEVVLYRLKPDVDRESFLRESSRACRWLEGRPGYLERELMESDDGQWIDVVRWETMEHALAAAADFTQEPDLMPLMEALDPESVQMLHAHRVA